MSEAVTKLDTHDPVWRDIRQAAITLTAEEPVLGSLVHASVLNQPRFEDALAYILAQRLGTEEAPAMLLRQTFDALVAAEPDIGAAARADLAAVYDRDPACKSPLEGLLFFKGFHGIQAYRMAHALLRQKRRALALYLQSRVAVISPRLGSVAASWSTKGRAWSSARPPWSRTESRSCRA